MSHAVRIEIRAKTAAIVVVALLLLLAGIPIGRCQPPVDGGGSASSDDAISQYISEMLYARLQNISGPLSAEIGDRLDYCIVNREKDWNDAFNFSSNLTFLSECIKTTVLETVPDVKPVKFWYGMNWFNRWNKLENTGDYVMLPSSFSKPVVKPYR